MFDNNLSKGQIVISKAGRDRTKFFVVTEVVDEKHVLIVNGKQRLISNPKKKRCIHLQKTNYIINDIDKIISNELFADSTIRNELKKFSKDEQ